jgi:hypothetical protein
MIDGHIAERVVHMRDVNRVSFYTIGRQLNITPTQAHEIYLEATGTEKPKHPGTNSRLMPTGRKA